MSGRFIFATTTARYPSINGKGAIHKAVLASAIGEYFELLFTNYFFIAFYLDPTVVGGEFVHHHQ